MSPPTSTFEYEHDNDKPKRKSPPPLTIDCPSQLVILFLRNARDGLINASASFVRLHRAHTPAQPESHGQDLPAEMSLTFSFTKRGCFPCSFGGGIPTFERVRYVAARAPQLRLCASTLRFQVRIWCVVYMLLVFRHTRRWLTTFPHMACMALFQSRALLKPLHAQS